MGSARGLTPSINNIKSHTLEKDNDEPVLHDATSSFSQIPETSSASRTPPVESKPDIQPVTVHVAPSPSDLLSPRLPLVDKGAPSDVRLEYPFSPSTTNTQASLTLEQNRLPKWSISRSESDTTASIVMSTTLILALESLAVFAIKVMLSLLRRSRPPKSRTRDESSEPEESLQSTGAIEWMVNTVLELLAVSDEGQASALASDSAQASVKDGNAVASDDSRQIVPTSTQRQANRMRQQRSPMN